jgi:hypothetical protein
MDLTHPHIKAGTLRSTAALRIVAAKIRPETLKTDISQH